MKLKNKKTGEIWDVGKILTNDYPSYDTLEQLNEEWEDVPEMKSYWYYDTISNDIEETHTLVDIKIDQEIGNYFETKEEAEKTVEKLKAWKRLKDNGITFSLDTNNGVPYIKLHSKNETGSAEKIMEIYNSLYLLFGGED